jgi:hypothetical protein
MFQVFPHFFRTNWGKAMVKEEAAEIAHEIVQ